VVLGARTEVIRRRVGAPESTAGEHEPSCVQFSQTVYRQQTGIGIIRVQDSWSDAHLQSERFVCMLCELTRRLIEDYCSLSHVQAVNISHCYSGSAQ